MVQNLQNSSVTSTSISVRWDALSCVDRNGGIPDYRIEYGTTTSTLPGTSFTANRLRPSTTYNFRVAGVRGSQTGLYSSTLSIMTLPATDPPLTAMLTGSVSQTLGASYTLTCTASGGGSGTRSYQFFRGGQSVTAAQQQNTLTYPALGPVHNGVYTCRVTSGGMMATSTNTVTISVDRKLLSAELVALDYFTKCPTAPPISVTVSRTSGGTSSAFPLEGREYTLTCTVSGHQSLTSPSVTYRWLNDSIILQSQTGSSLVFSPVDHYDNGTYTCRATISSPLLANNIVREDSTIITVEGISYVNSFVHNKYFKFSMQFSHQYSQL